MKLFSADSTINLLPYDGIVNYYGTVLSQQQTDTYFTALLTGIDWKNDEAVIFGKHIITKRKYAWYGNEAYWYKYSGATRYALPWTKELLALKEIAEKLTDHTFNSCLLNLYHTGEEGMAWHSDDERSLVKDGAIASFSFGAARKFSLKHRDNKQTTSVLLESGSLLVMKGTTQTHWLHSIPKSIKIKIPRINLTFRTMNQ